MLRGAVKVLTAVLIVSGASEAIAQVTASRQWDKEDFFVRSWVKSGTTADCGTIDENCKRN